MKLVGLTFPKPVYKSDASGNIIEVGDTLGVRLHQSDKNAPSGQVYLDLTVVAVGDQGRTVHWDYLASGENVNPLDVAAIDVDHNPPACP